MYFSLVLDLIFNQCVLDLDLETECAKIVVLKEPVIDYE